MMRKINAHIYFSGIAIAVEKKVLIIFSLVTFSITEPTVA